MQFIAYGVNDALNKVLRYMEQYPRPLRLGARPTRAFQEPCHIVISNPRARLCLIPERKWNPILPFVESLWISLGWNSLDDLPGRYVKKLYDFSDDGQHWRGGYGPRIRHFGSSQQNWGQCGLLETEDPGVDQLDYVIETLKADPNSRQAIIQIGDPRLDQFTPSGKLLQTKDQPCTRSLHFTIVEDRLDLIVHMRSNDLLWGFSAVNVFNFTFMQEYVAAILGVPVGVYHHLVDNLHFYEDMADMVDSIVFGPFDRALALDLSQVCGSLLKGVSSLDEHDALTYRILEIERASFESSPTFHAVVHFWKDDALPSFYNDWALVFVRQNAKKWEYKGQLPKFNNPALEALFPPFKGE